MYDKILLATDGSDFAKKAGKHAITLAKQFNSEILILNVIETTYYHGLGGEDIAEELDKLLEKEGQNTINQFLDELKESECNDGTCSTINFRSVLRFGNPYKEILKIIEEENIDLTIIGNSGKNSFDRILLGSVSEKVIRHGKSTVLIVK